MEITKEFEQKIIEAANKCVAAKETLSTLFPSVFPPKDICDRINSWEDVCEYHKIHPVSILPYPSPINDRQEAANAFVMDDYTLTPTTHHHPCN